MTGSHEPLRCPHTRRHNQTSVDETSRNYALEARLDPTCVSPDAGPKGRKPQMGKAPNKPIAFTLSDDHRQAIESLAGGRRVRLSGRVEGGKVVVDFVACNSPFIACN